MLHIRMKGDIDKLRVPGDFDNFVVQTNLAMAKGMQYLLLENAEGNSMAINQNNILTVEDVGDEDTEGML
jgi:hypothetical protein